MLCRLCRPRGKHIPLVDSDTSTPVFDASGVDVSSDTEVTVTLEITDANGNSDTDTVTVTVTQTSSGDESGPNDGTNTGPGDPGFAQCTSENNNAINFVQFNNGNIDYGNNEITINKVKISDKDGDNDLTELEVKVVDDNGITVAASETSITGGYDDSYFIDADSNLDPGTGYAVIAVAYDGDGNCVKERINIEGSGGGGSPGFNFVTTLVAILLVVLLNRRMNGSDSG